jgi:hypothetical protein
VLPIKSNVWFLNPTDIGTGAVFQFIFGGMSIPRNSKCDVTNRIKHTPFVDFHKASIFGEIPKGSSPDRLKNWARVEYSGTGAFRGAGVQRSGWVIRMQADISGSELKRKGCEWRQEGKGGSLGSRE